MDFVFQTLQAQGRTQRWLAKQLGIDPSLLNNHKSRARVAPEQVSANAAAEIRVLFMMLSPAGFDGLGL